MTLGIIVVGSILLILFLFILIRLPAIIAAPPSTWLNVIGLTGATIIPFLIFFIPGYYKGIAVLMHDGFPLLQISLIIAFLFILWVSSRGRKILESDNDIEVVAWQVILYGFWVSGIGVFLAGALVGAPVEPYVVGSGLLGEFMNLFYAPGLWLFHVVLVLFFTINLPAFIAGMIYLSVSHPAASTVKQSMTYNRPDHEVEQDLAKILQSQQVTSEELEALWAELSPLKRWLWKIQFHSHARKSATLASLAKSVAEAHRKDTDLGQSVHEMERARRERQ